MTADRAVAAAVQATAFLAAACRAAELARPAPRVRDELAPRFVAARPAHLPDYRALLAAGGEEVVARTALLDAVLAETLAIAAARGRAPVLVNLGAGFCTRPYRLDLSACQLVLELDAAPVLEIKAGVLAGATASAPVQRVGLDLRDQDGLAATLASRCAQADSVIVLSEGLLPYLPVEAVTTLAATLGQVGEASWLTDLVCTASAQGMAQLARAAGVTLPLYGLDTLAPVESSGWAVVDYRILPVARRTPLAGGRPGGGSGPVGGQGARASHGVVDGVVVLHHTGGGQPEPGRTSPDS